MLLLIHLSVEDRKCLGLGIMVMEMEVYYSNKLTYIIGDNWIIECDSNDVDGYIYGKTLLYIKHRDTNKYLYTDNASKFNEHNCRRCPIVGHSEISSA
jgi:hypothetical protein